jgi:hypothetical protein
MTDNDKLNKVAEDVAGIKGLLEGKLPHMATKDDLNKMLEEHKRNCHVAGIQLTQKQVAALVGVIVSLATAISTAISHISL